MRFAGVLCLAGALVLCATPVMAQSFDGASPEPAAVGCYYTFSSGSGAALVSYCLTENGNIVKLEAPAGQSHNPAGSGEGYVICSAAGVASVMCPTLRSSELQT